MEFLEDNQITEWLASIGIHRSRDFEVQLPAFETTHHGVYADGRRSGREPGAAADLASRLGPWDECLVWITTWGIWASGEDWPRFYAWRGALDERRSIDKAPGHRFGSHEALLLAELLVLIMENAWDAHVLCSRSSRAGEFSAFISHDEWYEIRQTIPAAVKAAG